MTDDGTNETAMLMVRAEFPWVKWVKGPNAGRAANRNNGAAYASGIWLAFIDDDCVPDANWLLSFWNAIKRFPQTQAFEGAIKPDRPLEGDLDDCPVNLRGGLFWSANIAIAKETFDRVGGFDKTYKEYGHEDVDLKFRLQKLTEITFVAEASVTHPVRLLRLSERVRTIRRRNMSWAFHTTKNAEALKLNNWFEVIMRAFESHGAALCRGIITLKPMRSLDEILSLTLGIGWLTFYAIYFRVTLPKSQLSASHLSETGKR